MCVYDEYIKLDMEIVCHTSSTSHFGLWRLPQLGLLCMKMSYLIVLHMGFWTIQQISIK